MNRTMSRTEIAAVLRQWQVGLLTAEQVHTWAEELYFPGHLDFDDEENGEESVANEVMRRLDMLNINLMIVQDVPIYLEFLETAAGHFEEGYRRFGERLDRIDIRARQRQLARIPFYAPFCEENPAEPGATDVTSNVKSRRRDDGR